MKKNLLTLMFVIAFVCVGVSVASAKNSALPANSVAVSKKLSPAKIISNKIKVLESKCGTTMPPCASQLHDLIEANANYMILCGDSSYPVGCGGAAEQYLLQTADIYELCLWWNGHL